MDDQKHNGKKLKDENSYCHNCNKPIGNDFIYYPLYNEIAGLCIDCIKLDRYSINTSDLSDTVENINSFISDGPYDDNEVNHVIDVISDDQSDDNIINDNQLIDTADLSEITDLKIIKKNRIVCSHCFSTDDEYFKRYGYCACGAYINK